MIALFSCFSIKYLYLKFLTLCATGTRTTATHGYVASVAAPPLQPHWAIRLEPLFLQFLPLMSSWHANEDRVALISITSISLCNRAPIDATIDMLGAYGYVVCSAKPSHFTGGISSCIFNNANQFKLLYLTPNVTLSKSHNQLLGCSHILRVTQKDFYI